MGTIGKQALFVFGGNRYYVCNNDLTLVIIEGDGINEY